MHNTKCNALIEKNITCNNMEMCVNSTKSSEKLHAILEYAMWQCKWFVGFKERSAMHFPNNHP